MALREASGTQNPVYTRVISGHCVLGLRLGKVVGPLLLHFWGSSFIIWGTLLRLHVACSENGLPFQTASLVCLCTHLELASRRSLKTFNQMHSDMTFCDKIFVGWWWWRRPKFPHVPD